MQEFSIRENEAGQRLDKYLGKLLREAPRGFCYKMLRKKNITLNGRKAAGSEKLVTGDVVRLYFSEETFRHFYDQEGAFDKEPKPFPKGGNGPRPDILYEDENILLVNKPAGILSVPARAGEVSMTQIVTDYLLDTGALSMQELHTFHPAVCNRLDKNTSGILCAGKTLPGLQELSRVFRERKVDKRYLCLAAGHLTKEIHDSGYLWKDIKTNKVAVYAEDGEDRERIEAWFRPLGQGMDCCLVEVKLLTGKSHQIRAALARLGYPIIGDPKYGNRKLNEEYRRKYGLRHQLLHAFQIRFEDTGGILSPLKSRTFAALPGKEFLRIRKEEQIPGFPFNDIANHGEV